MGLNLFVYRLPFLVTFLAYNRLGNSEFDTLKKNCERSHRNRGLLLRNSQQSRIFCLLGTRLFLYVLHSAKSVLSLLLPNTLAEITLPLFQYTIIAEVRNKSSRG